MVKKIWMLSLLLITGSVHAALNIQHWTLDNGARVYFVENHAIPVFDVSVDFDAGARRDPVGKTGTASITNGMLARGIRQATLSDGSTESAMTESEISDALADLAAQRGGGPGSDRAGMSIRTLSTPAERDQSIRLLARLLAHPSIPDDFLRRDKARTISSIKEALTKPESIADKAFWRLAYNGHPYANEATVETVEAITRDDLLQFHQTHYVANRAVIAMIGDVSREQANAIAIELTRRLPQGSPLAEISAVTPSTATEQRYPHPASQSHILIGMPALARGDKDFFALTVGNYILGGGGFVSRIYRQVREQRGLAYSSYSYFNPMAQPGPYIAGLQTRKDQTDEALKVVRETIATFLRDGPTDAELKAAKDNLMGGFALRIDNNRKILENLSMIGYHQLPLDYLDTWTAQVNRVTVADIRTAFARKLSLDRMVTVVVGAETK
ncbi:MAG: insulinase family protein [Oxalobacteraceae bacterium]|jgi:zinc protease|nr:insulinase family protein [Oxalobacteraceae bacterium]